MCSATVESPFMHGVNLQKHCTTERLASTSINVVCIRLLSWWRNLRAHWHDSGVAIKLISPFGLFISFYDASVVKPLSHASDPLTWWTRLLVRPLGTQELIASTLLLLFAPSGATSQVAPNCRIYLLLRSLRPSWAVLTAQLDYREAERVCRLLAV